MSRRQLGFSIIRLKREQFCSEWDVKRPKWNYHHLTRPRRQRLLYLFSSDYWKGLKKGVLLSFSEVLMKND